LSLLSVLKYINLYEGVGFFFLCTGEVPLGEMKLLRRNLLHIVVYQA